MRSSETLFRPEGNDDETKYVGGMLFRSLVGFSDPIFGYPLSVENEEKA